MRSSSSSSRLTTATDNGGRVAAAPASGARAQARAGLRLGARRDALALRQAAGDGARERRARRPLDLQARRALDQELLVARRAAALARDVLAHLRGRLPTRAAVLCMHLRHEADFCDPWLGTAQLVCWRHSASARCIPARGDFDRLWRIALLSVVALACVGGDCSRHLRQGSAQQAAATPSPDRYGEERWTVAVRASFLPRFPFHTQLVPQSRQPVASSANIHVHAVSALRTHAV